MSTPIRRASGCFACRSSSRKPVEQPRSATVAPASSGPMPSMIAARVQRSRKWVRDASAWTASSSSDQLTDFGQIYDERYYDGKGADPLVDYGFELTEPERTIRRYEWRGVTQLVKRLLGGLDGVRWLDFGCGNGGLVRYALENSNADVCGFEEGSIAAAARGLGIPILAADELNERSGGFDVVTA